MAAAASPFSFHCMICIEEFHQVNRYPVVLPCGHTYVCNLCADKLDKCMECRTPLSWTISKPPNSGLSYRQQINRSSGWSTGRVGGRALHSSPMRDPTEPHSPVRPTTRRLPLPKNVVLLSLMEATEIANEHEQREAAAGGDETTYLLEDSDEEQEKIKSGTSLAVGGCGTYVVVAENGLQVFPSRPTPSNPATPQRRAGKAANAPTDEDIETLVRFFHMDHKMESGSTKSGNSESVDSSPPVQLNRGDRIQIVSLDEGWAKLARGYGFVRVEGGAIAKVGGAIDKACSMEAMLRALSSRRQDLRTEQSKIDKHFVALMSDLEASMVNDEDLTVIGADTFSNEDNEVLIHHATGGDQDNAVAKINHNNSIEVTQSELGGMFKPHLLKRSDSPPILQHVGLGCFSNEVLDPLFSGSAPASRTIRAVRQSLSFSEEVTSEDDQRSIYSAVSHPSPSTMSAGGRAWRERNGHSPSRGIDFRTGLSGHMALLSSHANAHPHEYLRPSAPKTSLKMSCHSGLTVGHSRRGRVQAPDHMYPTTPAIGESKEEEHETRTP